MTENKLTPEDRQRLVLTEGAHDQALEIESLDKKLGDLREDILDVNGQMAVLKARAQKLQGERDEIRADFWNRIRADHRQWFREMSEAGFVIIYSRPKDPNTGEELGVMIRAANPNEEMIRQIFRNLGHDSEHGIDG